MFAHRTVSPTRAGTPGTAEWIEVGVLGCYPPIEEGDEPIRRYYASMVACLDERGGPYVSVTDASSIQRIPNARERKLHAELANAMSSRYGARCRMAVVVVPSALLRAAVTAVSWLIDRPVPMETVATLDEAITVARRAL